MKEIPILFTRHERRIESYTVGFYDLKFSDLAIDFSLMSHDIQCIHKGSSCILLRSSMSKVSCLKIHNLTLSTIKSCLPNWSTMVSVTWLCSGLKVTFLPPAICPIQSSLLSNANHQVWCPSRFDFRPSNVHSTHK